jgi:hypothetical protein
MLFWTLGTSCDHVAREAMWNGLQWIAPMGSVHSPIYEVLLDRCTAAPVRGGACQGDTRRGTGEPDSLLAALRATFPDERLRRAGVLVTRDSQAVLHPDLVGAENLWTPLQSPRAGVFDILGERGCFLQRGPALLGVAHDQNFRGALATDGVAFLVGDVATLAYFRAIGLPAATLMGLDNLNARSTAKLRQLLGAPAFLVDSTSDEGAAHVERLVLVDWSLREADASRANDLTGVIEHLRKVNAAVGLPLDTSKVWRPSSDDIERISLAARVGEPANVRAAIENSLATSLPLIDTARHAPRLSDVIRDLGRIDPSDMDALSVTEMQLRQVVADRFTLPLFRYAEQATDPLDMNVRLELAFLFRSQHDRFVANLMRQAAGENQRDAKEAERRLDAVLQSAKVIERLIAMDRNPGQTLVYGDYSWANPRLEVRHER